MNDAIQPNTPTAENPPTWPAWADAVLTSLRAGCTMTQAAEQAGVSRTAVYNLKDSDPAFAAAYERARGAESTADAEEVGAQSGTEKSQKVAAETPDRAPTVVTAPPTAQDASGRAEAAQPTQTPAEPAGAILEQRRDDASTPGMSTVRQIDLATARLPGVGGLSPDANPAPIAEAPADAGPVPSSPPPNGWEYNHMKAVELRGRIGGRFLLGLQLVSPKVDSPTMRSRLTAELHAQHVQPRFDGCAEWKNLLDLRAKRDELNRQRQLVEAALEQHAIDRRALLESPDALPARIATLRAAESQANAQLGEIRGAEESMTAPIAEATEHARAALQALQAAGKAEALAGWKAKQLSAQDRLLQVAGPIFDEMIRLDVEKQATILSLATPSELDKLLGPERARPPAGHVDVFLRPGERQIPMKPTGTAGPFPGVFS